MYQKLHSVLYFLYSINNMTFLTCSCLPPDVHLSRSFLDLFGFAPSNGGPKIWFKEESFVHVSWAVTLRPSSQLVGGLHRAPP